MLKDNWKALNTVVGVTSLAHQQPDIKVVDPLLYSFFPISVVGAATAQLLDEHQQWREKANQK